MRHASFSELRNRAKEYFDAVEGGEAIEIYRHGKPVAILVPVQHRPLARWKTAHPLRLPGVSLSRLIVAERRRRAY